MDALKDFPVITPITVAWGEMDALQHVNNVAYFRYFETARLEYFDKIGLLVDMAQSHIGPILSETSCKYLLPITYPDTLSIGSRVVEICDDRIIMEYQIWSHKWEKVTTIGRATGVMFDFNRNTKVSISDSLRASILALEKEVSPDVFFDQ